MRMPELNLRNHLLHDFEQILLRPFADFTGGQRGSRVGDEESAEPLPYLRLADQRFDLIGQIHDLLELTGADTQNFSHGPQASPG